nr:enhancer of rudimentary homolog [Ipomoea trifida]
MDYDSITQAMDGICALYERKLKELNLPIYDISDLYNFINGLVDTSALVYDHSIQAYLPYDRQWIKQKTLQHLKEIGLKLIYMCHGSASLGTNQPSSLADDHIFTSRLSGPCQHLQL